MLVSRVASLGRLQHKAKGYCGPLNRALLAYHSMIASLQNGLRDLLEMTLTLSLLDGGIDRERRDWMDLSLRYVLHEMICSRAKSIKPSFPRFILVWARCCYP